ncbi:AAA family ATPase [Thalassotalea sp. SU-HH00458]|uniref:AAA family ATPase n=1 Tax=Thalassotalea sp. SU-HH00458 TaxID=3127657 RepID=UPI00310A7508
MQELVIQALSQIERFVIGKPEQVKLALACLLAKGHLLIEDLPGMGKTTLAHVLASSVGLNYQRVQFTSDLLPADVIGVSIFDTEKHTFTLHKGPIFNQVVLADEINRASPKTQSALLEAMEENSVSLDGCTHSLPRPFFVIATQNPLFHAGTYPLPESQLDRFMMRISLGFPDKKAEQQILKSANISLNYEEIHSIISLEKLQTIQKQISNLYVSDPVIDYVIALFEHSRSGQLAVNPLSPRAGKALIAAAKAWAFIDNRDHVLPDDIKSVFSAVCEHRMVGRQMTSHESFSTQILSTVDSASFFSD